MNLEGTETLSDLEGDRGEFSRSVPEGYGGILASNVRSDDDGNVVLVEETQPEDKDVITMAAEDPYWRGYREAQEEFNLRKTALELAVGSATAPALTWPEGTTIPMVAQQYLSFLTADQPL